MQAQTDSDFRINQLEQALAEEQRRLEKLWDAYERQERELDAIMSRVQYLETELEVKEKHIVSLEEMLAERDRRIRELEVQQSHHKKLAADYEPRLDDLKNGLEDSQTKFDKLLAISEELEEELGVAKEAIAARDHWFENHVGPMEEMARYIRNWRDIQRGSFLLEDSKKEKETLARDEFMDLLTTIPGIGQVKAERIYKAGFNSLAKLKAASVDDLMALEGFTAVHANKVIAGVKELKTPEK